MRKVDHAWLCVKWLAFIAILRIDLFDFQKEMSDGLLQLPTYADLTQARQSGKSFVLGVLIYFLAYTLKWTIIIVAPKIGATEHIMDVVDTIATYFKKKRGVRLSVHSTKKIKIMGRGTIKCISGDPYAFVEGHHAHLIVFDEKQDLDKDHVITNILPFRAFHNGLVWSLGIGGTPDSWGEYSRKKAVEPGNFVWRCPWQRVVKDKPEYQNFVDDIRKGMLPPEFKAHMECEELDMSSHLLIPHLQPYDKLPDIGKCHIQIGLDFGSVDKTVATVRYRYQDLYFWHEWFVADGDYSKQLPKLGKWLKEEVTYDVIVGENNGVGRPMIDMLNSHGFEVVRIDMDQNKKTRAAHRVMELASGGRLKYNPDHELSVMAHGKLTKLSYKMTTNKHVKVDHCDFYSSGIVTLLQPPKMRLSA